jgi:triacylglycerol esterase/lipase EstA (alpha/beta hydrolase family)
VGESVQIAVQPETLDFLLKAKSLRAEIDGAPSSALVVGPNRARDRVLLAASLRISPGEYTAKLSATSVAGEERVTTLAVVVKPRTTVPSSATRPPVVLLNGWETGFTGACNVSTSSADTFGILPSIWCPTAFPSCISSITALWIQTRPLKCWATIWDTYLNSITYDNGDQVPQIDLVAFSMGGLIARAYLAGLQPTGTATPPATPWCAT